jgi:prepilin-type N-terminal cleavage/methylation domain-containing protein/prepilin-type processing-associated H-X9-DG protein
MKRSARSGFNLVELLVVIAIIGILMALLFPALSLAREKARSAACKNHLRQVGLGLQMYVQDYGWYPPLADERTGALCFDRLLPYYPISWTNASWNCPTYVANQGLIGQDPIKSNRFGISYSYNWIGIGPYEMQLGLGHLVRNSKQEHRIAAPSDMFAVSDARCAVYGKDVVGQLKMSIWSWNDIVEAAAPHAQGYNLLFCDGHVLWLKRGDYLSPPRAAAHWNNDNQPHRELWRPLNQWAVQN